MAVSRQSFWSILAMDSCRSVADPGPRRLNDLEPGNPVAALGLSLVDNHYADWQSNAFYATSDAMTGCGVSDLDVGYRTVPCWGTDLDVEITARWTVGAGFVRSTPPLERREELDADVFSVELPGGLPWGGGQGCADVHNELVGAGGNSINFAQVLDRPASRAAISSLPAGPASPAASLFATGISDG